jgi:hypothetical protein
MVPGMTKAVKKKAEKTSRVGSRSANLEVHPDAQRRFERAVDIALHTKPTHKSKPAPAK